MGSYADKVAFFAFFIYTVSMKIKYYFLTFLCVLCAALAQAQADIAVNEDAFLVQKAITVWGDETSSEKLMSAQCQAVRITPDWLLTAAHCVYDFCRNNQNCTVQVNVVSAPQDDLAAQVRVRSGAQKKNVFIFPGYNPRQNRSSSFDVALIRLAPQERDWAFFAPRGGKRFSREQFEKQLDVYPESRAQWNAKRPRLLTFDAAVSARLTPAIAVPRVENGGVSWLYNAGGQAYFISELQHFVSTDFGVRQGNSGGGVFTADGQLVGVVSMSFTGKGNRMQFKDADGKAVSTLQNADAYFVFTGFTSAVSAFIRGHVPGVFSVGAVPQAAELTNEKFTRIIKTLDNAQAN